MTKETAREELKAAANLIFDVEKVFPFDSPERAVLISARSKIGDFQNILYSMNENDITKKT